VQARVASTRLPHARERAARRLNGQDGEDRVQVIHVEGLALVLALLWYLDGDALGRVGRKVAILGSPAQHGVEAA